MNRADLAGRIDVVEHRMDSIEHRLDASFAALSAQIVQSHRETRDEITATLRGEMRAFGEVLRGETQESSAALRGEMGRLADGLRGEMREMGSELGGKIQDTYDEMCALHTLTNARFEKVEAAMAEGLDESRRFMLILHEEVLSRFALLDEGRRS